MQLAFCQIHSPTQTEIRHIFTLYYSMGVAQKICKSSTQANISSCQASTMCIRAYLKSAVASDIIMTSIAQFLNKPSPATSLVYLQPRRDHVVHWGVAVGKSSNSGYSKLQLGLNSLSWPYSSTSLKQVSFLRITSLSEN